VNAPQLDKSRAAIAKAMSREVEKGRKTAAEGRRRERPIETWATGEGYTGLRRLRIHHRGDR
jgi:hypothetical protein